MTQTNNEPYRCWYCANWKENELAQCAVCGNSGKAKPNGYTTGYRK